MRKLFLFAVICALPLAAGAQNTDNYMEQGGAKWVVGGELEITSAGTLTIGGTTDFASSLNLTLGAAEKFAIDASTTAQTQTAGAVDIGFASITANTSGFDLLATTNDGTATGTDIYGMKLTLTQNDADADFRGFLITAAATTNAAAGSYEYGISFDCAENTSGACLDGLLITSTGISGGLTDAIDVSASNITNAINIGSNLILGGNSDWATVGATDASFIVSRNDSGAVSFLGADDAGAADTIYDTTGAGAITVGSADVTSVTVTTDSTGDAELVLPENSIGPDEVAATADQVILCGDIAAGATTYWGPNTTILGGDYTASSAISSTACSALDSDTEATADAALFANTAFKITGMFCKVTSSGANGVTVTARSAEADTTPVISCTIATGETTCSSVTGSTTDIAAGATVAIQYEDTEDLSAQDGWCKLFIALK